MNSSRSFIKIHPEDNVAVALRSMLGGETCDGIALKNDIPPGHKWALCPISKGENIIKYGQPIGQALCEISPGEHIHTHNVVTNLNACLPYTYTPQATPQFEPTQPEQYISAYLRKNGDIGIRNNLWIIPTVCCVNKLAERLACDLNKKLPLDGDCHALALTHPYGCSQLGQDLELTRTLLAQLACHPNAGGVLILSLGCENNTLKAFMESLKEYDSERIKTLIVQKVEDEYECGMNLLEELLKTTSRDKRSPQPLSRLIVGLKCGGSDGLSGITANPLIGRIADSLTTAGSSVMMTEVPEMFGAEHLLMNRCKDHQTFENCVTLINNYKNYFLSHGFPVGENPSPGNKEGGITTLEEKSLGCIQKGGLSPVNDILSMGEHCRRSGLSLLEGPGNDAIACTLLAASGAHLILFSTGRGTPWGTVVPTLKIATNTDLAQKKKHWIDYNAGRLIDSDKSMTTLSQELLSLIINTANGRKCENEQQGYEEIALYKSGVTL